METNDSAIIGVYESHHDAIEALKILKRHKFPLKHVALVGQGEAIKEIDGTHTWEDATTKGTEVGALVGGVLGVLAGLSLITIPGIGLLYLGGFAGALIGGVGGTSIGATGGSIVGAILGARNGVEGRVTGKMDMDDFVKYQENLKDGHYLIIVHGPDAEIKHAHDILVEETKHAHVESHTTTF
jgi:hypothetical protein